MLKERNKGSGQYVLLSCSMKEKIAYFCKSLSEFFYVCLIQMFLGLTGWSGFAIIISLGLSLSPIESTFIFFLFSIPCSFQVCPLPQFRPASSSVGLLWSDSRCLKCCPFHSSHGCLDFSETSLEPCHFFAKRSINIPHCSPDEVLIPWHKIESFKFWGSPWLSD